MAKAIPSNPSGNFEAAKPDDTANKILVTGAVMLATLMIIIDMTVVNVAMPDMMGALAATPDQISWVLTSYIVAEAITIPLSGFLAERFGRRLVILVSVAGFVLASALCGQASTLTEMVIFRIVQGAFGASVIPLSQSILVTLFSAKDRGKAMAIWGIGIMLGPILGPTLGGLITDHMNWRWVFYINLPVGVVNLILLSLFIPKAKKKDRTSQSVDWLGALFLAIGIGSLQTFLDRGNQDGWLQSSFIMLLCAVSLVTLTAFLWRSWNRKDALLRIDLLRDPNLASSSLMMFVFGTGLFGTIALQPIMLENLFGYPAGTAGLVMAPRGLASAAGMVIVANLITRVEARWLVLCGLILAGIGSYAMTGYNLSADTYAIVMPSLIQGLGLGMVFVPLSTLAFATMPAAETDRAASIYNLSRTIGSSMGIAVAVTVHTRTAQTSWMELGGHINPFNPALSAWLHAKGLSLHDPLTPHMLASELTRQANMLGFIDAFAFIAVSFVILAPLVLLLKGRPGEAGLPD